MNERQKQLLGLVVENYVVSAEPVGSRLLVEESDIGVSGATIRNEMRFLEEKGFLTQPHTSAGRMPTEQGYQYYVEHVMKPKVLVDKIKSELQEILSMDNDHARQVKNVGRYVAESANNAVIIAINSESVYYTGISNLFSQPEFRDYAHVASFSTIFDQCEDRLDDIFGLVKQTEPTVLIGSHNPFGRACSMIISQLKNGSLFALMGPMRMDYNKNFALISHVQTLF